MYLIYFLNLCQCFLHYNETEKKNIYIIQFEKFFCAKTNYF